MNTQIATIDAASAIEQVVIGGDLSRLTAEQRVNYYKAVCQSIGLNPLTKPFDYINLNGKLTLYARKDASDQLRRRDNISIEKPDIRFEDDWIIVTVAAHTADGRSDADLGVVSRKDMRGDFGNALMKAVTKAKRRVTLSICGLGMLDETEVETIPDARRVSVTDNGEIVTVGARVLAASESPAIAPGPRTPEEHAEHADSLGADLDWQKVASAPQAGQKPTNGDGKPRAAILKTPFFKDAAAQLATDCPYYAKDGKPDSYHMLGAAAKLGYGQITDNNLSEVMAALKAYAADVEAQRKAA